jgi:hypothetical protein
MQFDRYELTYELSRGTRRLKFGDVVSEPYGILTVPLRTPGGIIPLLMHVVPQNLPLLIGADILDAQQRYNRNVTDELVSTAGWSTDCMIARALLIATRFR